MSILMVQYVPYIEPPPSLKKPLKVKVKENNGSGGFGQFVVILSTWRGIKTKLLVMPMG